MLKKPFGAVKELEATNRRPASNALAYLKNTVPSAYFSRQAQETPNGKNNELIKIYTNDSKLTKHKPSVISIYIAVIFVSGILSCSK